MLKRDDWWFIFFWAGMVIVMLGVTIDAMIKYRISLEKIIAPIHQEEWSWGLGIALGGLAILLISLVLMIIELKKENKKE